LFERYVTRYEEQTLSRRSDEEVWRPVIDLLDQRSIAVEFEAKTIVAQDDRIEFSHAWQNGVWHMYEPVSLDLADSDGIITKARKWLGNLTSVSDASEQFVPHFILGAPSKAELTGAYEQAKRILAKSPIPVRVYEEAEVGLLVDRIEQEVLEHRMQAHNLIRPVH
jgi:hypothetical protein